MNQQIYLFILFLIGIILSINYRVKYHKLPITVWKPVAAWNRALIYFVICNIISVSTGTFETIISQPIATMQQLSDPIWILFIVVCFSYIFIAYWILWARMTLTFDRQYHIGSEIVFGILWGGSTGQLLLSFYHLWALTSLPGWAVYLCSYACMGAWQYFVQDYFWDIYVSPEHDTPWSIKMKTLISHIPNVALCLLFLVLYNNYFLYVLTQMFGLIAAAIFQKFPAPWTKGQFHAPMTKPGMFGMPHGAGYLSEDVDKKGKKIIK